MNMADPWWLVRWHSWRLTRWRIERSHRRVQVLSLPVCVEAAAPKSVALVLLVSALGKVEVLIEAGGLIWLGARPVQIADQEPADRQRTIAHDLRVVTVARLS